MASKLGEQLSKIKGDGTILRISLAIAFLVFAVPALHLLVVEGFSIPGRVDFIFHIQRTYLITGLALIFFAYLAWDRRPKGNAWSREQTGLLLLSLGLTALILWGHVPLMTALEHEAVRVTEHEILYDHGGLLGVRWHREATDLFPGMQSEDILFLPSKGEHPTLNAMLSYRGELNGSLIASINGYEYDLTNHLLEHEQESTFTLSQPLNPQHILGGANTARLRVDGDPGWGVTLVRQTYYQGKSRVNNGELWGGADGKLFVWIADGGLASEGFPSTAARPSTLQLFIFKIRPFLVLILGMVLLITAVGTKGIFSWAKAAEMEAWSSILLSILGLQFIELVKGRWDLVSSTVVNGVGHVLQLFYGEEMLFILDTGHCPYMQLKEFGAMVCKSSSGVESIGYFTLLFLLVLLMNWKQLNKLRTAIFYVIGLGGAMIVNVFRLILLLLAGVYISPEFSSGAFHTNIGWVLFLGYAALYWFLLLPYLQKK